MVDTKKPMRNQSVAYIKTSAKYAKEKLIQCNTIKIHVFIQGILFLQGVTPISARLKTVHYYN